MKTIRQNSNKIAKILAKKRLQAFLVSKQVNITYLTGHDFRGHAFVLYFKGKPYLLTDRRYENEKLPGGLELVIVKRDLAKKIKGILGRTKRLAVEDSLTLARSRNLEKKFTIKALKGVIEEVRMIKEVDEIEKLEAACRLTKQVFQMIEKKLKPGLTEKKVAWEMEKFVRERGADELAFGPIVAGGENGGKAHAELTDRKLRDGDLVTIDFGVKLGAYHSDMTRTFKLGKVSKKQADILKTVKEAQKAALAKIKPGVDIKSLDQTARDLITKAGYGEYFSHASGHGVGLEIHEKPSLTSKAEGKLRPGMVFTVEPGIYLEDMGVRWEDTVLVTKVGCKILT